MRKTLLIISIAVTLILIIGCGSKGSGSPKIETVPTTKLEEVLAKAEEFTDKNVTVKGNFFASCTDSCCDNEFILKDGINQIKVFKSKELELPKMKSSQPIRISGILKATAENPVILASSVEIIK